MNENLKKQLKIDEGCRLEVYLDSEGLPTFGIGHLLGKNDIEYFFYKNLPKGGKLKISQQRVNEVFEIDVERACKDCKKVFIDFGIFPEEVQDILANMMFNLGVVRFIAFKKFINAVEEKDWKQAAKEMMDSKWYRQVGNRAKRLVARMESINV